MNVDKNSSSAKDLRQVQEGQGHAHSHLMALPDELLLRILSHLSSDNALDLLENVSPSCRRLRRLCRDPALWTDVGVEVNLARKTAADHRLWAVGRNLHGGTRAVRIRLKKGKGKRAGQYRMAVQYRIHYCYSLGLLYGRCPGLKFVRCSGMPLRDLGLITPSLHRFLHGRPLPLRLGISSGGPPLMEPSFSFYPELKWS